MAKHYRSFPTRTSTFYRDTMLLKNLKLYGVDALRVVDASIMPDCVRANINVIVMAMAEMIVDFIKQGK